MSTKQPVSLDTLDAKAPFEGGFFIAGAGASVRTHQFPAAIVGALVRAYQYDSHGDLVGFEPSVRVEDAHRHVLWRPAEPAGPLRRREGLTALINTFWIPPT